MARVMALLSGIPCLALLAVGCSSSHSEPEGPATTSYVEAEWEDQSPALEVKLVSYSGECALHQSNGEKASSRELKISIQPAAGQTSIPPGTYTLAENLVAGGARAAYDVRDASCAKLPNGPHSMSGTITLKSALGVSGSATSGSYSIQLDDGTTQSGDFSAPACAAPTTSPASTCEP
jgi:hypothetical protein